MKRKYTILIISIILVGLMGFKLYFNKEKINESKNAAVSEPVLIPVKTATADVLSVNLKIIKTGKLAPFKESKVMLPTGGIVQQIRFELGDNVREGQVLAVIDNRANELELEKMETKVAKLKNDLETYKELYEGKAATREKLKDVQQSYDEAVNQVKQLSKKVNDAYVKAPISGIVASKSLENGAFANMGAELTEIVNLSTMKVEVNLTETEVYQVAKGQEVKISTNVFPDKVFTGKVTFISPQADAAYNYAVEVTLDNRGDVVLRSGTFVYADFSKELNETVLAIPRQALMESISQPSVYVVKKDEQVEERKVEIGKEINGNIEILKGLKQGEVVVTTGHINLKDGTKVRIAN
ncbi:efflux RND transporter periplasmic adaptor subunit [Flammeovirgaceae bacterium SG7u.111]|nr:efflux RND transporter periplasmic adaptor subunit [Flammeovirgaceae bacterium SG7u.132]WPO37262.1 efflux RND transporter periplasmic adaptor subunit [Flammeovirgaceae bacterium SG7u.111]